MRSDRRSSARQTQVIAARPPAVPAAPAQEAPLTIRTTGTRAQLNAPQRATSLTGSGDLRDGTGTAGSPRTGSYYNAVVDLGSPPGGTYGGRAGHCHPRHAPACSGERSRHRTAVRAPGGLIVPWAVEE
ncbi:hypothetical protein GCM10010211_64030 [Streptomyces albospinus]|uniref:Uncharacterized protein n=1 Tax=Streptomyces albospinus TaxID=285515 RepID=A0ABQ2VLK3_9ACTN|nr:hypothetical protein GCM10010211_64030 [Streptomyces albospinus]